MGMYTQAKGILNIHSIGYGLKARTKAGKDLSVAQSTFISDNPDLRTYVCNDTQIIEGSNGSLFIAFGIEIKNYSGEIRKWLDHLLTYFPTAEGIMTCQYEEDVDADTIFIYKGKITDDFYVFKQVGYGNTMEVD